MIDHTRFAIFLSGIALASFAGAALFFLRFWMTSKDRFFLLFSIACLMFSFERVISLLEPKSFTPVPAGSYESFFWQYTFRFVAFILIAIAIVEKNRGRNSV